MTKLNKLILDSIISKRSRARHGGSSSHLEVEVCDPLDETICSSKNNINSKLEGAGAASGVRLFDSAFKESGLFFNSEQIGEESIIICNSKTSSAFLEESHYQQIYVDCEINEIVLPLNSSRK